MRPAGSIALDEVERTAITDALQRTHGHNGRAAVLLGLTWFRLYSRVNLYLIEVAPK